VRIAILGAGAVGSYYGALLARAGHDVRLFARGAHLAAVRAAGLTVRTPQETFTVPVIATDQPAELAGAEYALVTVKSYGLPEIAPVAADLAAGGATIVPLLNGIDADDRLAALGVARERILPGLTTISVVRVEPGVVERRSPFQRIVIGEVDGETSSRALVLGAALHQAGVPTRVSRTIRLDLWRKFAFLAPLAAACGLTRQSVGELRASREGQELIAGAVAEVIAVGRRAGIVWSSDDERAILDAIAALPAPMKPSFLLDVERGGPTDSGADRPHGRRGHSHSRRSRGGARRLGARRGVTRGSTTRALSRRDPPRTRS
jgi:2-dehydropantoate 2-reductase